ncbi:hypothetical protein BOSEA31B_10467 [Hyphomicrobiales bacterium]|nr:hypothetical protein BOSEA31B_10467 [Hyphomicrobiales bacterium]CAH1700321.1 hypothetical protein BOSEA1005_20020 [Hyphomicrobiales bacterium]CAI0344202.1 hypothetical protein BO1005MUT1_320032 [Hyphomicrobiales bacterium]
MMTEANLGHGIVLLHAWQQNHSRGQDTAYKAAARWGIAPTTPQAGNLAEPPKRRRFQSL